MVPSKYVPVGDFDWCANKECPKRHECGRNGERLQDLPYGCAWWGQFQPDENGHCDLEKPYRNWTRHVLQPYLQDIRDHVGDAVEKLRKKYDEDGSLDEVQTLLEDALESLDYQLNHWRKEDERNRSK
jgi:hypothetical protein